MNTPSQQATTPVQATSYTHMDISKGNYELRVAIVKQQIAEHLKYNSFAELKLV